MSRYKAYSEYRESGLIGLGKIPVAWPTQKIKYIFNIGRGRVISQEELDDSGYPVYSSQTMNDGCLGYIATYDFNCSQITWTTDGANAGTVFLRNGKHNCTNVCGTLQPKITDENLKYFLYCLEYVTQFYKRPDTNGAKIMNGEMAEIAVTLPTNFEKDKIAAFLDHETAKIDALIEKQQRLIELLKEKRQAVISHAVTKGLNPNAPMKESGVEWLGEVPAHWDVKRIKQISLLISKGTTPSTIGEDLAIEGVRFLKAENIGKSVEVQQHPEFFISKEVNERIARSKLEEGDVLVIIAGATTGMASVLDKRFLPANTNQAVSFIRPARLEYSKLIVYWLSTEFCQRTIWMGAVQAAQPNLSMEDLGNIPIAVPPDIEIGAIGETINLQASKFDHLISKATSAIELMQERRTALISAAVTGKIDVRDWQATA